MGDFKSEYRRAVDNIEPDGKLTEYLKADMKAAIEAPSGNFPAPPKANFFIRYRWAFASAAACLVMVFAVGIFLSLGRFSSESMMSGAAGNEVANGGMDIDITENLPELAEPDGADNDGFSGDRDETDSFNASVTSTENAEFNFGAPGASDDEIAEDADKTSEIYSSILDANLRSVEWLKAVSYEELKALVALQQEVGLTLGDIDFYAYDAITELGYDYVYGADEVYLVMRYDYGGSVCPLIAAFSGVSPSDRLTSLRLYFGYDTPYRFIDLSLMSVGAFEDFFWSNDILAFNSGDMPFDDIELYSLEPISLARLKEWAALAKRGELTYGELEKCGHVTKLYKGLYTMGSVYIDEKTGRSYALISCYFVQSAESAPAYVILRETDSGDTLDLLHEYYMLDRFLQE